MTVQIGLRTPTGQSRVQVDEHSTLRDLIELIKSKTGLSNFSMKYGFPPKALDISPALLDASVDDLHLRGETILVTPVDSAPPPTSLPPPSTEPKPKPFTPKGIEPDQTSLEWPERGGYLAFGGAIGLENPSAALRNQVADYILSHPNEYNKAILGDEPHVYTTRMRRMDTWGGAIELSILSDIYNLEISSIDVKSLRVDRFGEGKENRVIILYSGIHYDRIAFCMDLSYPVEVDVTQWSTDDDEVLEKARQLAQQLQRLHYYTDTTDFVIKCEICDWIGQGVRQAGQHEKETGHSQFGEMQITD
ncbi:uncharacterized protein THITE_125507 [Thermothielavioides terrestris NRRL 8126]|uniref:Ubiquitin thioesterase OTU n=1 Tax=Thermothielavioides terrestris (strain ATCC 38088 / NRRL 8126) TaxID=578455 RepID=G2R6Q9_THETT|nr:uncharacterized protein THITE_125507 [Thermothielavioides terrestris NRRL 8126]AEO67691.1 hypothetical protein THITE_125507 [Thermothielavioides terrestris NRRL 8126]